jgi:hypothetical protein
MNKGETRTIRFPATPYCSVPAAAYSVTITAVPRARAFRMGLWFSF